MPVKNLHNRGEAIAVVVTVVHGRLQRREFSSLDAADSFVENTKNQCIVVSVRHHGKDHTTVKVESHL